MEWVGDIVMANDDLVGLILQHAALTPESFVAVSRVNKAWRRACLRDNRLLLRSLAPRDYLTKAAVMGLLGFTSAEANRLPHTVSVGRDGRLVYQYHPVQVQRALELTGGMAGREMRIAKRAIFEGNVARVYGNKWRSWWDLPSTGIEMRVKG